MKKYLGLNRSRRKIMLVNHTTKNHLFYSDGGRHRLEYHDTYFTQSQNICEI